MSYYCFHYYNTRSLYFLGEGDCEVTGIAQLSSTRLLVADSWNKKVKIVSCDPSDPRVVDVHPLPNSPFDVTLIPGNVAAVTVPDKKQIMFFQTQNDQLKPTRPLGATNNAVEMSARCYYPF